MMCKLTSKPSHSVTRVRIPCAAPSHLQRHTEKKGGHARAPVDLTRAFELGIGDWRVVEAGIRCLSMWALKPAIGDWC